MGEIVVVPLGCGRNSCPHCRRRNVQVTAAKMALNQTLSERPVTHAVLTTTRDWWVSNAELREGWRQFARHVRKVAPDASYAWFREWTTGRYDGIRRTHYHSTWALDDDAQAAKVAEISREVWTRIAGAWSPDGHGWKRVWDAGGLARYIAGLVGHHMKHEQQAPPEWSGRRYGTSRGFYAIDSRELDRQAKAAVSDERLRHHLEAAMFDDGYTPDELPDDIWDELLTERLAVARERRNHARIVRLPNAWAW